MTQGLCGIDEAGRGPIAGDLVVAGVILDKNIEGLNDSKKISEAKRESLYEQIIQNSSYHIVSFSPLEVDNDGISKLLKKALLEIKQTLNATRYLFDGNSNFGVTNLETMIKADAKVAEVKAASILAKVSHDRAILEDAKKYPHYQFEKHKGYATALHVKLLQQYGYSPVHRKSYKVKALREPSLF